jgi:type IV pilus assembly protein PilQ
MLRIPLLLLVLTLAASAAAVGTLPDDPRYDVPVALSTGGGGETLAALIDALARTVGWTPILDPDVAEGRRVALDLREPRPFRQVWTLALSLADLRFRLEANDVVLVGSEAFLTRMTGGPIAADRRVVRVQSPPEALAELLRVLHPNAAITALPLVGALAIDADEAEHAAIAATLASYDAPSTEGVEQRTHFLSYASAGALADVLMRSGVVAEEGGAIVAGFGVVAEPRTNALIITAPTAVQERLAGLITSLDQPQPQVNVQVRIQEITRRSALDLGIDWSFGAGNLSGGVLGGVLGFMFDTTQVISSLNLGAVLNALETQGLARRIEEANLTVLNNVSGSLKVGGRFYVPLGGDEALIPIDYGVAITLTPRITADGRISLDVSTKVDDLISISNYNVGTRELRSTTLLEPGQTLVLGGLLSASLNFERRSIPILGRIPLIGDAFARNETVSDDTDLLIIVHAVILD